MVGIARIRAGDQCMGPMYCHDVTSSCYSQFRAWTLTRVRHDDVDVVCRCILWSYISLIVIAASSRRTMASAKKGLRVAGQTSVTRKKRSTSSTGSAAAAAERFSAVRPSSAGGDGVLRPTTVDDGREVVRTGTTTADWNRCARPGVGNVRQLPRCFHLDSVMLDDDNDFLSTQSATTNNKLTAL